MSLKVICKLQRDIKTTELTAAAVGRDSARPRHQFDVTDAANIALFLAVFIGLWQLVYVLELWPKTLMPSPATVVSSISKLISNNSLTIGIGTTLWRLAL